MATPVKKTTNYDCYLIGTELSHPDYDEAETITETWRIKFKESRFGIINPEEVYEGLVKENAVPAFGEDFDTWCVGRNPAMNPANGWGSAYCIGVEYIKTNDGSVIVQCIWSNRKKQTDVYGGVKNAYPLSIETSAQQRETVLYKRSWSATPPLPTFDQSAAISGSNVANNTRDGMPYYVNQNRYRIRRAFNVLDHSLLSVIQLFSAHVGKRNSAVFMNNAIGTMEFEGFNIVKLEGPFYEIVFDFIYDQFAFHSQTVGLAADGLPITDNTGLNLTDVKWTRPTKGSFDFNIITWQITLNTINTDVKPIMEQGYWTNL